MSEEVFEIVKAMDQRNVEMQLCLQCAPVISGLKPSNLLIISKDLEKAVIIALRHTGLLSYRLAYDKNKAIFLVFNRRQLSSYLANQQVMTYLNSLGYEEYGFGKILSRFQERYKACLYEKDCFPHELGILLGYPLADVIGFIEHQGREFRISGYWKVYDNPEKTGELFKKFDRVKDEMILMLSEGMAFRDIVMEIKETKRIA